MSENEIDGIEILDTEETFSEKQTSEELNDLMESEGLVATESEEKKEVFIEEDRLKSLLESILFSSPKPLTFDAIKQVFKGSNIKVKQLRRALEEYASDLAEQGRGVYIEEVAGGYQLRTKIENVEFLKQVIKQRPFRISGPSMEVMAIIAYKQPCIKAEVDTIRGVESGHLIRVLMDKGLVQFDGKSDLPGKPMLYKTTKKFLEVFGLRNIRELPTLEEIDQLIPEGIGGEEEESQTLNELTGELSLDYATRDQEAEEELGKITDKLSEISTSSEYFEQEKERQRMQREKDKADDIRERVILGQMVEEKEINWLKRFEQKLAEPVVEQTSAVESPTVELSEISETIIDQAIENVEFHAGKIEITETVIDASEIGVDAKTEDSKKDVTPDNIQNVASKLSNLAGAAFAASNLFEDEEEDLTKNKLDV